MSSIAPITSSPVNHLSLVTSNSSSVERSDDLLSAMNPAIDAALAVGRPHDLSGAQAILGTAGAYIQGAHATISKLGEGIAKRRESLKQLQLSDPKAAEHMQTQIDLLQRLQERIELSIERVSKTMSSLDTSSKQSERSRKEQLALDEQRRLFLVPNNSQQAQGSDVDYATRAYSATRANAADSAT